MRPKDRASKYKIPETDPDLFHALYDILYEDCFQINWTALSRALGIDRRTAMKWDKDPPKEWWWPVVLRYIINYISRDMAQSSSKKVRKHAEQVRRKLYYANLEDEAELLEMNTEKDDKAARHLLAAVNTAPGQSLSTQDLRKPGIGGGISLRAFRRAAERLQLDIHTEGFGKDKVTYYEMPRRT